jgi:hypothetical protein
MGIRNDILKAMAQVMQVPIPTAPVPPAPKPNVAPLPDAWLQTTYAPGWPIRPISHPIEEGIPREIDYPVAVNATIQPRTNYGLMPFAALAEAYENVSEIRMCVNTLVKEVTNFTPRFVDKDGNQIVDHPYKGFLDRPDGVNPFTVWASRFLQSALVFDAGTLYIEQTLGKLKNLRYVDGSTIFVLVDQHGELPLPDAKDPVIINAPDYQSKLNKYLDVNNLFKAPSTPAFVQVIKGTPFGWYSQDEMWYRPRFRRYNAPYGMSPIEMSWAWVLIIANISGFELAHYREGNMPEGLMQAPEGWTLEQIDLYEQTINARQMSGLAERNRIRLVPSGFNYVPTKKPDFPKTLYEQARDNLSLAYGIPPSEWGKMPGSGLGGKGFGDMMQNTLYRMGLSPLKLYLEGCLNEIFGRFGITDKFELGQVAENIDPQIHTKNTLDLFRSGVITLNDALSEMGREPIDGGDERFMVSGGGLIKLSDYLASGEKEKDAEQDEKNRDSAATMLNDGRLTTKFISVQMQHPHQHGGKFAPKAKINTARAREIGDALGVKWDEIDLEQFRLGLQEEQEHEDITQGDPMIEGRIALAHLKENPSYYTLLSQLVETQKGVGVSAEDDGYYGAQVVNIADIPYPNDHHANSLDIVALKQDGMTPVPALWKPEGGEVDTLIERVGGGQYLREEAAYLLDRLLQFYLVPVAFVTEYNKEAGAVVYYVKGSKPSEDVSEYDTLWVAKAGTLDFIMCQTDRHTGNYRTHPDDDKRMILIDNGLGFPEDDYLQTSPFVEAMAGKQLPKEVVMALKACVKDKAVWDEIKELVGETAQDKALERAKLLLETGVMPNMQG